MQIRTFIPFLILIFSILVTPLLVGCSQSEKILTIPASAKDGFNFPYLLVLPQDSSKPAATCLVVEPNNTGSVNDEHSYHMDAARNAILSNSIGPVVARNINAPIIMPVFPRSKTEWKIYTHALDRDCMQINEGPQERLDLQLIAMIKDAQVRLEQNNISVRKKVVMIGFSASGSFVNRFTHLHPEIVQATVAGGINGILMLPVTELESVELPYPLGVSDFVDVVGEPFNFSAWLEVPQFIFMGENDANDAVLFNDGYSDNERKIVYSTIGKTMLPDRWENCQAVYTEAGANVTFHTYADVGHGTNDTIHRAISKFVGSHLH